jgi:hypothetical protein
MQASVGDRVLIRSRYSGESDHHGEVIEVRGPHGEPPYVIRWEDGGREVILYPGSDTVVQHSADLRV